MNKSRQIVRSTQFKKDFKKISASGRYDVQDLLILVLARTGSHSELF